MTPPFLRRIGRMSPGQIAASAMAFLLVCALVGGSIGTILLDLGQRPGGTDDSLLRFEQEQERLIDEQRRVVEDNPDDAQAMGLLASYLAIGGDIGEAITWYERSLRINPNDTRVRLSFADSLAQTGRFADSELQYRRVLEADPGSLEAIFYLADLYQFWQPEPRQHDAAELYQQLIEIAPDSVLAPRAEQQLVVMGFATPVAVEATPGAPPVTP